MARSHSHADLEEQTEQELVFTQALAQYVRASVRAKRKQRLREMEPGTQLQVPAPRTRRVWRSWYKRELYFQL